MTEPRRSPLDMDAETFRTLGRELVDQLADALASIPARPITPNETPDQVHEALDASRTLPEEGAPAGELLRGLTARLFDHSLFNAHPRFFGYITAPPAPIGILGDLVASALNANVGSWALSPAATEIEAQTIRWIAEMIGYPTSCGGVLVSGGNMANFVGFFAARAARTGWDIRRLGNASADGRPLAVYVSAETHTWIQKAADLSGIGTNAIRWIETDVHQRMDLGALRQRIAGDVSAGVAPFLVVGTAGSVSTGAIDPLADIAAICREHDLWFHVDGAYGGFAAAADEAPADLRALALADSVAVDPHKWLYAPLEAGCALVRDPRHLRDAFSYHPPYYHFDGRGPNFVDHGMQNSRGFRALKVWLALQHAGAAGYRAMIGEDMRLARGLADAVGEHPELELVTQNLSITTFRYVPPDLRASAADEKVGAYLNRLNQDLLERLQSGGEIFVSNAVVTGRYVLRACIVNFHTSEADVAVVPGTVAREGRRADARLRGTSGI
ncbi:MAG: aspartate aminotransferase family protein [Vicinamibacterales bacterium]